jgi:hypothetical protein
MLRVISRMGRHVTAHKQDAIMTQEMRRSQALFRRFREKIPREFHELTFVWADTAKAIGTLRLSDIQSIRPLPGFGLASMISVRPKPSAGAAPRELVLPVTIGDIEQLSTVLPPRIMRFPSSLVVMVSYGKLEGARRPELNMHAFPLKLWKALGCKDYETMITSHGGKDRQRGSRIAETTLATRKGMERAIRWNQSGHPFRHAIGKRVNKAVRKSRVRSPSPV